MLKYIWFLIVSTLFLLTSVSAVDVSVTAEVGNQSVFFTYLIQFEEREEYSSFAFEKPRNSRFISLNTTHGEDIRPQVVGDFFLINPDKTASQNFTIYFESTSTYNMLQEEATFSNYVAFNFDEVNLYYEYIPGDEFSGIETVEIFPRDYALLDDESIGWTIENLSTEQLFLISYASAPSTREGNNEFIFLVLLLLPILFFVLLLIFLKYSPKSNDKNEEIEGEKQEIKEESKTEEIETVPESKKEEVEETQPYEVFFDDFIRKYLTEKEQEVVKVVRDNEGLPQNDLLDHVTRLSKSNLSKIVTKLHNKKVLSRIRVGKVNKIYLGDKLRKENYQKDTSAGVE